MLSDVLDEFIYREVLVLFTKVNASKFLRIHTKIVYNGSELYTPIDGILVPLAHVGHRSPHHMVGGWIDMVRMVRMHSVV